MKAETPERKETKRRRDFNSVIYTPFCLGVYGARGQNKWQKALADKIPTSMEVQRLLHSTKLPYTPVYLG